MNASHRLERIELLTRQISDLEETIFGLTRQKPDYNRLLGIPGIGRILALTIL